MTDMTTENLEALVRNATFSADMAAIGGPHVTQMTGVEKTRQIVRRVIEFLYGNDLMEFKNDGSSLWLKLEPPFDKEILEIAAEEVIKPQINSFHSKETDVISRSENGLCECDRPDQMENPRRHTLDVACVYWSASRPSQAARLNATHYLNINVD